MEIRYNFGGFYESLFSELLDDVAFDEGKDEVPVESINWRKTYKAFSKDIVIAFQGFLEYQYDIKIELDFVELLMPKQYNFSTDTIVVKLSKDDRSKLDALISNDEELIAEIDKAIINATTSRSGYVPFYEYNKVLNKKDKSSTEIYYQLVLDALMEHRREDYSFYMMDNLREGACNAITVEEAIAMNV